MTIETRIIYSNLSIGKKFNFLLLYSKLNDYIQEKIIETGMLKKTLKILDIVLPIIGIYFLFYLIKLPK